MTVILAVNKYICEQYKNKPFLNLGILFTSALFVFCLRIHT